MFINPHFFLSKCQYGLKNTLVFLSNLYSVIPYSNELCIHQVPLVTLFFQRIFQVNYEEDERRPTNHARSSIFFMLRRKSKILVLTSSNTHKGMYFILNSISVFTQMVASQGPMHGHVTGRERRLWPLTLQEGEEKKASE